MKDKKHYPLHLYSLSEYGRLIGESPQLVKYWARVGKLESVITNGGRMILHNPNDEALNPKIFIQ